MNKPTRSPAYKRYFRRHLVLTAAYVLAVFLTSRFVPDDAEPTPLFVALALLPGIAVIGWIWAMGRLLVELDDEFMRMLEVRKFIVATGVTLGLTSVWGMVELYTTVPRIPIFFVFPIWCAGLMIGTIVNRFAFGTDTGCPR